MELCCPITLELFRDPVKTLHGQTYERAAIEEWLASNDVDPLTGATLAGKAVFPDAEMRSRCEGHARSLERPRGRGGRGGRGRGRGSDRGCAGV